MGTGTVHTILARPPTQEKLDSNMIIEAVKQKIWDVHGDCYMEVKEPTALVTIHLFIAQRVALKLPLHSPPSQLAPVNLSTFSARSIHFWVGECQRDGSLT